MADRSCTDSRAPTAAMFVAAAVKQCVGAARVQVRQGAGCCCRERSGMLTAVMIDIICCTHAHAGRLNFPGEAVLPRGEWPQWCPGCRGSGRWYCKLSVRCLPLDNTVCKVYTPLTLCKLDDPSSDRRWYCPRCCGTGMQREPIGFQLPTDN